MGEWVAYARQLHDKADLPAGSFETHFHVRSGAHRSGEARGQMSAGHRSAGIRHERLASRAGNDVEVGGERGRAALDRLRNAVGRVEASWRRAGAERRPVGSRHHGRFSALSQHRTAVQGRSRSREPQHARRCATGHMHRSVNPRNRLAWVRSVGSSRSRLPSTRNRNMSRLPSSAGLDAFGSIFAALDPSGTCRAKRSSTLEGLAITRQPLRPLPVGT